MWLLRPPPRRGGLCNTITILDAALGAQHTLRPWPSVIYSNIRLINIAHGSEPCRAQHGPRGNGRSLDSSYPHADAENIMAEPNSRGGKRILIVDDLGEVRQLLMLLLQKVGHDVVGVASGAEALAALAEQDFDVALLDIRLPDIDGTELARRIRADESLAGIMLIAVTGDQQVIVRLNQDSGDFDDCVIKPFAPDDLFGKIAGP